ncbi:hypothetical protein MAR_025588 [Mya arenaria]|uniref:Uncharacterized protein n=1 Tax=Mya arenaria TaxID=6604 RepID=A0ABY7ES75_MYAAR|nr:hypothetical protein MAR_025588 [Mya arenaria]
MVVLDNIVQPRVFRPTTKRQDQQVQPVEQDGIESQRDAEPAYSTDKAKCTSYGGCSMFVIFFPDMAEQTTNTCTYREAKDFVMTAAHTPNPKTKLPSGAQQNVWMCLMSAPNDNYNEVYPNIILGD